MVLDKLRRAGPIVASALLYSAAFPPLNISLLVFVALTPWLVSLVPTGEHTPRGFRSGFLFGVLISLYQMSWTISLIKQWTGSSALGMAPWLVCGCIGGVYFGLLGSLIVEALRRNWWWAVPLLFAGHEVFRSFIPGLAFPYFLISTPLWHFPYLIQSAFVGTQYLVSAWVVLFNVLGAFFLIKTPLMQARPYAIVCILGFVASLLRFMQPIVGELRTVVAMQPGVDMAFSDPLTRDDRIRQNVSSLYPALEPYRVDVVVFPEGFARAWDGSPPSLPFELDPRFPTIVGGQRTDNGKQFQSAFAFNESWSHADKARLVMFGEYVPFREHLPFLDAFRLPNGDLTPAETTEAVTAGGIRVGPLICFEGLFWDIAQAQLDNRAQLLAVMAIDDWYMGTAAPDQLRAASVWRAVETDLPVIRAASTGYTMVIDQRGVVVKEVPVGGPQALVANLKLAEKSSPSGIRPYVPWLLGVFPWGFAVYVLTFGRRRASAKP